MALARPRQQEKVEPTIFTHSVKEEWGRGTLLQEAENKRQILWDDGRLRAIHASHWDRLIEVELSPAEKAELHDELHKKQAATNAAAARAARKKSGASKPKKPPISWAQQLEIFAQIYPGGFDDPTYRKKERGNVEGKEASYKELATRMATQVFDAERMQAKIKGGGTEVFGDALEIAATVKNMLHFVEAGKLTTLPDEAKPAFAQGLFDLLHGDAELAVRFDAWVKALPMDPRPTWTVATIFQSFFAPDEHVFVKPTFWLKQAAILEKDVAYDSTPDGKAYAGFLEVAQSTRHRLEQAGLQPRDLMDVYTFTWRTLAPKAIKSFLGLDKEK
jgi:hypothetical protein